MATRRATGGVGRDRPHQAAIEAISAADQCEDQAKRDHRAQARAEARSGGGPKGTNDKTEGDATTASMGGAALLVQVTGAVLVAAAAETGPRASAVVASAAVAHGPRASVVAGGATDRRRALNDQRRATAVAAQPAGEREGIGRRKAQGVIGRELHPHRRIFQIQPRCLIAEF